MEVAGAEVVELEKDVDEEEVVEADEVEEDVRDEVVEADDVEEDVLADASDTVSSTEVVADAAPPLEYTFNAQPPPHVIDELPAQPMLHAPDASDGSIWLPQKHCHQRHPPRASDSPGHRTRRRHRHSCAAHRTPGRRPGSCCRTERRRR